MTCALLVLCACDSGGSELDVLNESDQDVIVRVFVDGTTHSVRVPARTSGHVFSAWGRPDRDIRVYDAACKLLASVPFERSWLHIASDMSVSPIEHSGPIPDGISSASLEPAACR